jgi:hypothetical protein
MQHEGELRSKHWLAQLPATIKDSSVLRNHMFVEVLFEHPFTSRMLALASSLEESM